MPAPTAHWPRRHLLLAMAALGGLPKGALATPWPDPDGSGGGLATDLGERLERAVKDGDIHNLHTVFIARQGRRVFEYHGQGPDERWGTPLGTVRFDADSLHDLRSVSKSIVGLLYGIALQRGLVPALDTPLLDAFPAYADLARDERRREIRVVHALNMTLGLEWNEDLPYSDPNNSEIAMERSPDRCRYVLERPIVATPGQRWRYSGGATALLGQLIARGAGQPLLAFAQDTLFIPLGITQAEWTPGLDGNAAAASGLRLSAADLARIGQLLLQRGSWNGRGVVPAEWIAASLTPQALAFDGLRYGHHWYIAPRRGGGATWMALGLGGQRLVVMPELELVYVIQMGNYQRADQLKQVFAVQNLIHAALPRPGLNGR